MPQPAVRLTERDSFSLAETFYPEEVQAAITLCGHLDVRPVC